MPAKKQKAVAGCFRVLKERKKASAKDAGRKRRENVEAAAKSAKAKTLKRAYAYLRRLISSRKRGQKGPIYAY